jgi:RNA polymerase sigma-70 factor (ECF subfamily)
MSDTDDTKAFFSASVEEHIDALYSVALRLTRKSADAEDLVAETAAKAWSAIDSLQDRQRFRPWIFRILHNRFISEYRKVSIRPAEHSLSSHSNDDEQDDLSILLDEQCDDFLIWWSNPEREFFNDLLGEQLLDAIDALPEAFRTTVILVNVEGFTYDEAADVLDVAPGTIRSRMKRGRTLLQKALWEQAQAAGLHLPGNTNRCET